ncbi:sulfatase family protein [Thalassotalea sp. PLHSN55]|uniref:sulfatase family protein n=1 Tax=Thalassotalea sp. PLHSN55 TaxID=3435888 RepID=UPI003F86C835
MTQLKLLFKILFIALLVNVFCANFVIASVFPSEINAQNIEGAKKRNIVFILTDDHRYDAMGFTGHPFMKTPHLDTIANEGVYLKNAFVTTSLCSPSRASILTGLYTHKHRVIDNNRLEQKGTVYFPQYLQQQGYSTGFIGKWHMGRHSDEKRQGFDHWVSFAGQGHYLPPSPEYTLNVNGKRVTQKGYITDELTDYAIDWMEQQSKTDKPFMLYLSHKAVHANFTPAKRHQGMYDNLVSLPVVHKQQDYQKNTPRWLRDQRNSWHGVDFPYHSEVDIKQYYQNYTEAFAAVDDSIGRVKAQLKKMGIYDETLIIYMGDNGFMFGEHGLIDKRVAYETSIRVPMLMQCPELFEGGKTVEQVVANIDIGPTILEAAGVKTPEHMDGKSFIALAQNKKIQWRDYFLYVYYWEKNFPQSPTVFALRGDRYKYITYYGLWDTDELYDLANDPGETTNLIAQPQYQEVINTMENRLYAMLSDEGGMEIPMNKPAGQFRNLRYSKRAGDNAADFPNNTVVAKPINKNAH